MGFKACCDVREGEVVQDVHYLCVAVFGGVGSGVWGWVLGLRA